MLKSLCLNQIRSSQGAADMTSLLIALPLWRFYWCHTLPTLRLRRSVVGWTGSFQVDRASGWRGNRRRRGRAGPLPTLPFRERTRQRVKTAMGAWPAPQTNRNSFSVAPAGRPERPGRSAPWRCTARASRNRSPAAGRPSSTARSNRSRNAVTIPCPQLGQFPAHRLRRLAARECPGHDQAPAYFVAVGAAS